MSNFKDYLNTYVFETDLLGTGKTLKFKPIVTHQIKKLLLYEASQDPMSIEEALDEVLNECVISPEGFDVGDLYLQDRFYLLVELRQATRGKTYSFQTTCSKCGSQTQHVIDLSKLKTKTLNRYEKKTQPIKKSIKKGKLIDLSEEKIEVQTNDHKTSWDEVVVNDKISVKLHLITRNMQKEAIKRFNDSHNDEEVSEIQRTIEITTFLYALSIVSITTPNGTDENLSLEDRIFFLDNIQQSEQELITSWFDKNDFGIDFSFNVVCNQCKNAETKAVPVENFFY